MAVSMPVLEDGLSDPENLSDDEQSSSIQSESNGRHQAASSDFLFGSQHSSFITSLHKQQFAKSTTTNGLGFQSKSFYICPPSPSSFVQPVETTCSATSTSVNESDWNQQKTTTEDTSSIATGNMREDSYFLFHLIEKKNKL